jgi:hemerythrin-like domain-containing protein
VPPTTLPDCLLRLSQDHIDLRLALNVLEGEVDAVAQYHEPDGEVLGNSVQYFANFLAGSHHPVEELIQTALTTRAPADAAQAAKGIDQHDALVARVGDLTLVVRNLFIDTPKWRVPFCATARAFIVMKRDHIRGEENGLFPLAVKHLTGEDWRELDGAARALAARP